MAAHLNLTIFSEHLISASDIKINIESEKLTFTITGIETIEDWEYGNHAILSLTEPLSNLDEQVLNGKILIVKFVINDKWKGGYASQLISKGFCQLNLWLDTSEIQYLDSDNLNVKISAFYNKVTENILTSFINNRISIFGIGVETVIHVDKSIKDVISKSSNVIRWVNCYGWNDEEIPTNFLKVNQYVIDRLK